MEQLINELVRDFDAQHSRIEGECQKLSHSFTETLTACDAHLARADSAIQERFASLIGHPEAGAASDLSAYLGGLIEELYETVRGRLNLRLQAISPVTRTFLRSQYDLREVFDEAGRSWPAELVVITRKADGSNLEGKRIFDLEAEALLDRCASHRISTVRRIVFRTSRFRISRQYAFQNVPLLETYREYFPEGTSLDDGLRERQSAAYETLKSSLEEIWQVLRFHLDLASASLTGEFTEAKGEGRVETALGEMQQMVSSAIERAREMLSETQEPYLGFLQETATEMRKRFEARLDLLRKDLCESGTAAARIRRHRRALRRAYRRAKDAGTQHLRKDFDKSFGFAKRAYYFVEDFALMTGSWFGMAVGTKERLLALADLPHFSEIRSKLKSFPPIYRRLFSEEPLANDEFLVGRQEEIDTFRQIIDRWVEGRRTSVVIIGQIGSGKTSLVNYLHSTTSSKHRTMRVEIQRRLLTEVDLVNTVRGWFNLADDLDSTSALQEQLRALERQVVFVEFGHNLMLRSIGGRQAAESFFRLVLSTRDHILWVLTVRERPWLMLKYHVKADQYFTHEMRTRFTQNGILKEALLKRHRTSGCRLFFGEEGLEDRTLKKLRAIQDLDSPAVQHHLEARFFGNLFDLSGGNMTAAMYHWLAVMEYDPARKFLKVNPIKSLDLEILRTFDSLALYSMAEIINHGVLTAREHSEIFQLSTAKSNLVLDYLSQFRLIELDRTAPWRSEAAYTANPVLVHQIAKTLESMNILY